MKAICLGKEQELNLTEVLTPKKAEPGHLLIKIEACGINPGDKAFIKGAFPPGSIPESLYGVCGVSASGRVIEVGEGTPEIYKGKKVSIYKSLKFDDSIIGTWSESAHMHYHHCLILPDDANYEEYSGSLVNSITPYAFYKQILKEGHKGIICTAGNSATGRAMLGVCLAYNFPIISLVRNNKAKSELEALDSTHILNQNDPDFEIRLEELANQLGTTAVFDGVGGELISKVAQAVPRNSSIYAYGFLGGDKPMCIHTSMVLMKALTIKGFGNFTSETVRNPKQLENALSQLREIISMPHFKTKVGKRFQFEAFNDALNYTTVEGEKPVFCPS